VKVVARIALFAILLAAVPLRGYSAVLLTLCDGHHAGAAAQEHAHEHADANHHHSSDDGIGSPAHAASMCSVCSSCCAGASLAPQLIQGVVFQPPGTLRIPFVGYRFSGFVPERLDRPPLVS
jgi:hypothetical protein